MTTFERDLASLINKHSLENSCNTPDFVLARHLVQCLEAFVTATKTRDNWYGISPSPGAVTIFTDNGNGPLNDGVGSFRNDHSNDPAE